MTRKPVVVGTDGSGESLCAVEWAAAEAARRSAPLRIMSVMAVPAHASSAGDSPLTLGDLMGSVYAQSLQETAEPAATVAPGVTITTELMTGSPSHLLADAADAASMLVIGAYGMGGYAQPGAGPESRYVTVHASCPVAVIREPAGIEHGEIVVGVRNADDAQAALQFAFEEAALREAHLSVVHACDDNNPPTGHFAGSLSRCSSCSPRSRPDRSGETVDTFLADLAVSSGCGHLKSGAPERRSGSPSTTAWSISASSSGLP